MQKHSKNNGIMTGVTSTSHASGSLDEIQGDGMRDFWGSIASRALDNDPYIEGQSYQDHDVRPAAWGIGNLFQMSYLNYDFMPLKFTSSAGKFGRYDIYIRPGRMVPTANENRPVNIAVKYLIKMR